VNWIKKLLGIDEMQSKLTRIENNNSVILSNIREEFKKPEIQNFTDLRLLNPITGKQIFSFKKTTELIPANKKVLINSNPNRILRAISSIPEFLGAGLLSQSFRFNYPEGIAGNIMKIAEGQGTAITDASGKILAHGNYISNFVTTLPFVAYSSANIIIKEHYLAKINENLEKINKNIENIVELEFIKKEVKIHAIIFFYKKAFAEFELINENANYRIAVLTNIINKNIEVYELIQFYKKAINTIEEVDEKKLSNNLQSLLLLQELFVFGKILEFKYANEYNRELVTILKTEFNELQSDYILFFKENSDRINSLKSSVKYSILDNKYLFGSWIGNKRSKDEKMENLSTSTELIEQLVLRSQVIYREKTELFSNFINDIEQPQEFIIEQGKLYRTQKNLAQQRI